MTTEPSVTAPQLPRLQVVTEVEPGPLAGRIAERLLVFLGTVLFVAGMLAAVPAVPLLIILVAITAAGDSTDAGAWAICAGLIAGAITLLWLGLRMFRGRRNLVVFLRRFGFDDASQALTFAVGTAMGRSWRLVTLDDSEVQPVGVGRLRRRVWGWGRWLVLGLLVALIAFSADWWFGGGLDNFFDGFAGSSTSPESDNIVAGIVTAIILTLIAGVILALIIGVVLLAGSALLVSTLLSWRVDSAIQRAEGSKSLSVSRPQEVQRVVDRIAAGARGINAPRFVVIKVTDALWQEVVRGLCGTAAIVLIDVSELSENVLWEVQMLKRETPGRIVVICRLDRTRGLSSGAGTPLEAQLCTLLAGEYVLAYRDPDDRAEMRRFAGSLGNMLNAERAA